MPLITTEIILQAVQFIAVISAIINFKKNQQTHERYFLFFLLFVVFVECTGISFRIFYKTRIPEIFNLFTLVSITFYMYYFSTLINKRKLPLILWGLFMLSFIVAIYTDGVTDRILLNPVIVGNVALLILCGNYFISLLYLDEPTTITQKRSFWIVSGLLLFAMGISPLLYFQPYLDTLGSTYSLIIMLLNIILYGSIAIGLWMRKQ